MVKVNLLLVDDEPDVLEVWKNYFSYNTFNIHEATSGEAAVRIVDQIKREREARLLFVLLDVKMPGLNGLKVLEEIKRQVPNSKIFIITGNIEDKDIPNTAYMTGKYGGDGFYEKSKIDFDALRDNIYTFIKKEKMKLTQIHKLRNSLEKMGASVQIEYPYKL
ncbi:MAG: response regulator [bacterium]